MTPSSNVPTEYDRIDKVALRRALGHFVTGVAIVTTMDCLGRPRGLTVNSFTSISLEPPLVLVSIAQGAASLEAFERCTSFAVNVLNEEQRNIAEIFATKSPDKFSHVSWTLGLIGAPRLLSSLAVFECFVHNRISAGDHRILLGRVGNFQTAPQAPLVYGQGGYIPISVPAAQWAQQPGGLVVVSCIAECRGRILLVADGHGNWRLPTETWTRFSAAEPGSLKGLLRGFGVKADASCLYSIFESPSTGTVNIVYRGVVSEPSGELAPARLFADGDIPWSTIRPKQSRTMLCRFLRERELDRFGIYMDLASEPRVARVSREPVGWARYRAELEKC